MILIYYFKNAIGQNAEGVQLILQRAVELETSPIGSHIRFFTMCEIVVYDFENVLQTQKFAMSVWTKCETSHNKGEHVHQGTLMYSENSMKK